MEGLSSDGAGTGTEIARGGVWAAGHGSEVLGVCTDRYEAEGADGDRPGPPLGPARPGGKWYGCLSCSTPATGTSPPSTSTRSWSPSTTRAQLQLGAPDLAGTWAHAGCAPARRAPAQASAPCASRHDAAPGRLAPRVGAGPPVGPDRDHGRRHQRDLLGLLRRRGGYDVEFPGAVRGDPGARAVLLALRRPGQPLLAHARGRRHGGQGQADPGRPCASAARHRAEPIRPRPGGVRAHVRDLAKRLPQERLAGTCREVYLPLHNARFATPAEDQGSAFVPFAGALDDILCVQQERTVGNDNTVRYPA